MSAARKNLAERQTKCQPSLHFSLGLQTDWLRPELLVPFVLTPGTVSWTISCRGQIQTMPRQASWPVTGLGAEW